MRSKSPTTPVPLSRQDTQPISVDARRGPTVTDIAARVGRGHSVILDGRYRLVRALGRGGMGTVYRGECIDSGRELAIKLLDAPRCDWLSALTGFLREARLAARIHHPNVIRMFERGSTPDGVIYLTMELLEGRSLAQIVARERLRWARVRRLMRQICAGVEAIHAAGVIHRDLKPSNCFVLDDDTVKILDFGIARLERRRRGSAGRAIIGTPAYMAPEQIRGEPLDRRADVYAAGVLLFELLCGRTPFVGDSAEDLFVQQLLRRPPKLLAIARDLDAPRGLQAILARALAKHPDARFASIAALDAALASL